MRNAAKRPIAAWSETDWLNHLCRWASQLTACTDDAADLAHTCLDAFHNRFGGYPWQHLNPPSAWCWCCQKLRALWMDAHRQAKDHPHLSWEALPEGVACVEIAKQVQEEVDSEAFLASLPKRLREVLELRLAGYSWAEAAQRLGVKASTLRGYLPALRAKLVAFFGYDPSKRGFESLIYMEGENSPSNETGGDGDEDDGTEERGFRDDTESAGGKSLSAWRGKRFGLRWVRTVLMGRRGRLIALAFTLLMLHLDILPAVASAHLIPASTRAKTVSLPPVPLKSRLATWLTALLPWQRVQETPPLAPAPGLPPAWGASASVYGGVVNLGNGNLCLQVPLVGWANGVSFTLVFNSQANPSQPSPIAPKWTHNWHVFLELSDDADLLIVMLNFGASCD